MIDPFLLATDLAEDLTIITRPGFVAKALKERSLKTDPELKEARDFVSKVWARARPKETSPSMERASNQGHTFGTAGKTD